MEKVKLQSWGEAHAELKAEIDEEEKERRKAIKQHHEDEFYAGVL